MPWSWSWSWRRARRAAPAVVDAYLVPPTGKGRILHSVVLVDGVTVVACRPLPYGDPLVAAADHALHALGYHRLQDWDRAEDAWRCPVQRLI